MSDKVKILWADDEIEHLKPQIMYLEQKGYEIIQVTNGYDAIDRCGTDKPDVVFLDESMPGIGGLDTLTKIKEVSSQVPVVMITKNEAEDIMEEAIGSQIADYLIKPVKPQQILLTLKRILDNKRLVSEKTNSDYQQEFSKLFSAIQMGLDYNEWTDIYKKLTYWELKVQGTEGREMVEVLNMQKTEANNEFVRFIEKNYEDWMYEETKERPTLSHTLFDDKIFPILDNTDIPTVLVIIDNLRFDQWKTIEPMVSEYFSMLDESMFYSILPTSTQYSRNAIFSGLTPAAMAKRLPDYWKNDTDDGGKNNFEHKFLEEHLKRKGKDIKFSYTKVTNNQSGKNLVDQAHNLLNNDLSVIVYNFVDMLSHARTEMEVLKELASDELAYRSLTRSWFDHSPLFEALKRIAGKEFNLLITTDHGTIRVQNPVKVIGDRSTTTNLRYKHGKNLNFDPKQVYSVRRPNDAGLPAPNVSSSFIFAKSYDFLVYPNNFNHYAKYYKDTFQHGGISIEECIIPFIQMKTK